MLSWALPDKALQNGLIIRYIVNYTTNETKEEQIVTNTQVLLTGLAIFTEYNITVSSATQVGFGPPANVTIRTLNDSKCSMKHL